MKKRKLNLSDKPDLQAYFEDVNQITKPKAPEVSEIPDAEFRQLEDDRENSEKYEEEYEYTALETFWFFFTRTFCVLMVSYLAAYFLSEIFY